MYAIIWVVRIRKIGRVEIYFLFEIDPTGFSFGFSFSKLHFEIDT